ncbi:MAG: type II toxin-antitoxin system HicA family toxin [Dehalococcoidia bacterium]|nr:type II toxin-antitoxin system HicA family toxin [Dehalococcoidia bacterium]
MKRTDLIAHLESHGCRFVREGGRHSWYVNPATQTNSANPRHREIVDFLARKICQELGIPLPSRRA